MPKLSSFRIISEDTQLWLFPILFIFLKSFIIFSKEANFCFLPDSSSSLLNPHPFLILQKITFKWSTKVFVGDKNKWFCHHSAYLSKDPYGTARVVPWKTIPKVDMRKAAQVDENRSRKSCAALQEHSFVVKTPRKDENSKKKKKKGKVFWWIMIFLFWLEKTIEKSLFIKSF